MDKLSIGAKQLTNKESLEDLTNRQLEYNTSKLTIILKNKQTETIEGKPAVWHIQDDNILANSYRIIRCAI